MWQNGKVIALGAGLLQWLLGDFIHHFNSLELSIGLPTYSVVKNLPANAGDTGSNPGSGRSPEEGNGNPLQYSCLDNSIDRGAWWARVHKSQRARHDLAIEYTHTQAHYMHPTYGTTDRYCIF